MDADFKISKYLADNILSLRKKRNLSQDQLSQLAEIPRSTLTHIESGSGNPSLQNLTKISAALQVGIEELLSRPRNECELIEEKDVPVEIRQRGRARAFKLLPDKIRGLAVDKIEVDAYTTMIGHPHLQGAKEYLYPILGELTVHVAGDSYAVPCDSVFAFPGDQPHSYQNKGRSKAVAMSIIIPIALSF